MARIRMNFFIIISFVLTHTHSADDVVYSAVLPHTVTALTDSCVLIPCTFNINTFEEKLQNTKQMNGIWLKKTPRFGEEPSPVVFNSSQNIIQGHIEMIGNLTERNCTTVFYNIMMNHSDPYYFRLEMEPNVFRATFNRNPNDASDSSKTVMINVKDSPQPPELISSPDVSKFMMEGTAVNLICSAEAPCPKQPPTLFWTNIPKSANIITQLLEKPDKTHSVNSSMTFNASYMDHRMNISCTVTYPRNISNNTTVNSTVMLRLVFPPKETHIIIEPSASVTVGTNVTLTCICKASPSNNMTYIWYKRGQKTPLAWERKMSLIVTHNNTGWYFCTAINKFGNHTSEEIQLFITGPVGYTHVIAGCFGGTLAVLLFSVVLCMRIKTINESSVSWRDLSYQRILADDETLIIYYVEIDISKLQNSSIITTDFRCDELTKIHYTQVLEFSS